MIRRAGIMYIGFASLFSTGCVGRPDVADTSGMDATDILQDAPPDSPFDAPIETGADAADIASRDVATLTDIVDSAPVRPPPIDRTESESQLAPRRQSCEFGTGAWPAETLGTEIPVGDDIPIQHVLILIQENRSFDTYFSHLPQHGQPDVEVPPANWSNAHADGTVVQPFHDTTYCVNDLNHSWLGSHAEYDNGLNDGFVATNDPGGERSMAYEDESDLPFYYALANTFAIGDHYHGALIGPTWPNRYYAVAATSFGITENVLDPNDTVDTPADHIFARLDAAAVDWKDYGDGARMVAFFPNYGIFRIQTRRHLAGITQLMSDLANDTVPPFAFIEPIYGGNGGDRNDEHPPGTPQSGEAWVESIVRAVMASPGWAHTALFITYDENGGFADHVTPPSACVPDDSMPVDRNGVPTTGRFDRLGFRVPFIVVSPYARRHFVSHNTYDHTSLLRFVEARFGLPAMTHRDANAMPPMDMFDFAAPPDLSLPTLAASQVDDAVRTRCRTAYPSSF